MTKKLANAAGGKVKFADLMKQGALDMDLTEVEKVSFGIVVDRFNQLQQEVQKVNQAIAGMVSNIVLLRGLDPKRFGVNLGVGKILLLEEPSKNGAEPKG